MRSSREDRNGEEDDDSYRMVLAFDDHVRDAFERLRKISLNDRLAFTKQTKTIECTTVKARILTLGASNLDQFFSILKQVHQR